MINKRILVIGANGMLGSSLLRYFHKLNQFDILGTVRTEDAKIRLREQGIENIISGVDVNNVEIINSIVAEFRPDYMFNCVGIIKQLKESKIPIQSIEINSLLPHRLANICSKNNVKFIHFSTDCVFSGDRGMYTEKSVPDALDIYGRSKLLGEVNYDGHLTLRTSIIGHELNSTHSLIDWFLSQNSQVDGYTKAIFSGLPTCYLAEVIHKYVLPHKNLSGLYHLSVDPISKYELLCLVREIYNKQLVIQKNNDFILDRSLDSALFCNVTNFQPECWEKLIEKMHNEYEEYFCRTK